MGRDKFNVMDYFCNNRVRRIYRSESKVRKKTRGEKKEGGERERKE